MESPRQDPLNDRKWLFAHQPHIKCIRLGSVRSSHLPFKMHYVRLSLHMADIGFA